MAFAGKWIELKVSSGQEKETKKGTSYNFSRVQDLDLNLHNMLVVCVCSYACMCVQVHVWYGGNENTKKTIKGKKEIER